MPDLIHVLPDQVANQIAAGEVVQRPGSVVKELMENAVDSGASVIEVIIKDAGRTLVQVLDNGCGMSEGDATRCFLRHATSKIQASEDLFAIRTMGFRGEALASIGAVAQVELKTRRHGEEYGTMVEVDGGKIQKASACSMKEGSSIAVKNLFFNLPARRKFLKSNTAELRHIVEEFTRVALIRPELSFSLYHNGKNMYKLMPGHLKHRIISLFGQGYKERLIPVTLETEQLKVSGFVGKPEFARKTKGEQFFFANKRFIRHPYLHHSVVAAYQELIPENAFPAYFLLLEVNPSSLDVNIHPTKTEVKFEDEKLIYAMLRSAVRQALGMFNMMPSLDFERERSFELPPDMAEKPVKSPSIQINPGYNPFEAGHFTSEKDRRNRQEWMRLFSPADRDETMISSPIGSHGQEEHEVLDSRISERQPILSFRETYIVTTLKTGILVIDQHRAWERILFDQLYQRYSSEQMASQQQLFPLSLDLPHGDASLLRELLPELKLLGFDIRELSGEGFILDGIPSMVDQQDIEGLIDGFLQAFKESGEQSTERSVHLIKSMALSLARQKTSLKEIDPMYALIDQLFACEVPGLTPSGLPVFAVITDEDLARLFKS